MQRETELVIKPIRCSLELSETGRCRNRGRHWHPPPLSISKEEAASLGLPTKLMAQHNFRTSRRAVVSFKR